MKTRHRRIALLLFGLIAVSVASALTLRAFRSNLVFFFTPSQVAAKEAPIGREFRIGGLVEEGSLQRDADGLTLRFTVTDTAQRVAVVYRGVLPDLFREGRGCVVEGKLSSDGVFYADEVLAKHDENYMAPEAAVALERARKSADADSAAPANAGRSER